MRTRSQHAAEQQQQQKKDKLPDDLWRKILESVDDNGVMAFASVCKQLRRVQRESGRRLRTELKRFPRVYERGFLEKLTSRMSTKSEDWCLWSMRVLPAPDEEEKRTLIMNTAAFWGHLNLVKQSGAQGGLLGKDTAGWAAGGGRLEVLKYLNEQGCPWNEYTCSAAASGGHLEVLKYLHENGCPWDDARVYDLAAVCGHLDVLKIRKR